MDACAKAIKYQESIHLSVFQYGSKDEMWAAIPKGELYTSRIEVHNTDVTDMTASMKDGAGPTQTYLVKGIGHATRTLRGLPGQYDEDGKPDDLPAVTKHIECDVGYRESDHQITVFEYRAPIESEGYGGQILVPRPNSSPG